MNYSDIISYYYKEPKLRDILLIHSRNVADMALECARQHPEFNLNLEIIENGAMLHDIGIIRCNAPGIECYGSEFYIRHGILGAEMLRKDHDMLGLTSEEAEIYARICERHTGTGLTRIQIEKRGLPLPPQDWTPETMEEKIICYADKFFSKTHPERKKSFEKVLTSLAKFGEESTSAFIEMHRLFCLNS